MVHSTTPPKQPSSGSWGLIWIVAIIGIIAWIGAGIVGALGTVPVLVGMVCWYWGRDAGYQIGYRFGHAMGRNEGYTEGRTDAEIEHDVDDDGDETPDED